MTIKTATFGQRLAALRAAAGLTQQQLADRADTDQTTIARYEAGREPSWALACRLADALGCDVGEFRASG